MIIIKQLDKHEVDSASTLLYDVYVDNMEWGFSPNNPSHLRVETQNNKKILVDKLTETAIWFGAFDSQVLVGCIRLSRVDEYNKFDLEYYPSSKVVNSYMPPDKTKCMDVSKLAVHVAYSDKANVIQRLFSVVFKYCISNQCSIIIVTHEAYLKSLFTLINFPLVVEHAFKFEEIDPMLVNFYRAYYENSELTNMLAKLESLINLSAKRNNPSMLEMLEAVAPAVPALIYWHDADGVVMGLNKVCLDEMGAKNFNDIIGKSPYNFYPKEIAEHILSHNKKVMETREILSQEESINDISTGIYKVFKSIKGPLYDNDGNVIGIIGTSVNITAEKEAENLKAKHLRAENEKYKLLTEQQEAFRQKADRVVHDIRSPLASLIMLASYCTELDEKNREILRTASGRLEDIANDLLREYTPQKSKDKDFAQPTLVSTILLDLISEKRSQYIKSPVKFIFNADFDSSFAFINISRSDFARSISNITNNSVEALDNSDECIISFLLDSNEDSVIISIEDNGKGMSPELVDKLLKNESVTFNKKNGHGIGLSQVFDTLKNNNGTLDIKSKTGVGTSLILTFPRIKAPEWIAEEIKLNRDDIIIIIDDDQSIHGAWDAKLKVILKQAPDIQIEHFTTVRKALNFIENLSEKGKQKVLLLVDYKFVKEDYTGIDVIKSSGVKRSLLVTSFYNNDDIKNAAIRAETKILPKTLAPMILTTFNDQIENETKNIDLVLVDDDKDFVQSFVGLSSKDNKIDVYYDPEEFLSQVSQYSKSTKMCIDNIFPDSDIDGIDMAQNLHEQGYEHIYVISGKPLTKVIPSYLKIVAKEDIEKLIKL